MRWATWITPYQTRNQIKTLKYPFADIVKESVSEVTLKPNETKIWTAAIQMPAENYHGIILGGLHFQEKKEEDKEKESSENDVQIKMNTPTSLVSN